MTEPRRWRVAFFGTPPFAAEALRALLAAGHEVPLVLTQPDRPAGRGQHLQASAVKHLAQAHGLPVAQPQGLRLEGRHADDAARARGDLLAARPDVIVVAAYGLLLPPWALTLAPGGCLNIHASRLPRWRGAAPVHRAIEAGDAVTGITLMQMDEGLDTGAMVAMVDEPIAADDTTGRLMERLAGRGGELLVHALARATAWPLPSAPQPAEGVSYARKIDKAESVLDWRRDAASLARQVRALDPSPGATARIAGLVFKVWRAETVARPPEVQDASAGQVLAAGPAGVQVACGIGALHLLELQRPGGRRGPAWQALRAGEVRLGDNLLLDAGD